MLIALLFCLVTLSARQDSSTQTAKSQQEIAGDPFEPVPVESRAEVKADVGLIVKLHKERQWDKIYELLSPDLQAMTPRAQYGRRAEGYPTLLDFFPTRVKRSTEKDVDWIVNGCAKYDDHGHKRRWESFVEIGLKEGHKTIYLVTALKKRGGRMPCLQPVGGAHPERD
jgi:hypothetical protein